MSQIESLHLLSSHLGDELLEAVDFFLCGLISLLNLLVKHFELFFVESEYLLMQLSFFDNGRIEIIRIYFVSTGIYNRF